MLIMQRDTEIKFQINCPDTYTNQNAWFRLPRTLHMLGLPAYYLLLRVNSYWML